MEFYHRKVKTSSLKLGFCTIAAVGFFMIGVGGARAEDPAVVVKMNDMPTAFEPKEVTVKVGDTVQWKNVGNSVHHASSDPTMAMKSGEASTPPGAKAFDSGFLRPGDTYSFKFLQPGVYNYVCAPHETSGMIGKVTVLPRDQASR